MRTLGIYRRGHRSIRDRWLWRLRVHPAATVMRVTVSFVRDVVIGTM